MAEPVGRGLARLGLTPNMLTLIGFGIAILAAVAAGAQAWLAAGLLVIFGGIFDMFDGLVARATGKASKAGAFMDSTFDRWGEAVVYVGIVWGCVMAGFDLGAILAAAAMAAAFMVSYTRARAESLGFAPGKGMANVGFAPREVRLVILTAGVVLAGLMGGVEVAGCGNLMCVDGTVAGGALPMAIALALLVILATITTIQRIVVTLRQASTQA
jgi:CDP-diacylglycerol--glycerol-3-phosphate 3-phosphatidyltransferase